MNRNHFSRGLVSLLILVMLTGAGLYLHGVVRSQIAHWPVADVQLSPVAAPATTKPSANSLAAAATPTTGPSSLASALITSTPMETAIPPAKGDNFSRFAPPAMMAEQPSPTASPTASNGDPATQPTASLAAWSPVPAVVPPAPPAGFLADAQAKTSTGDLLGARKMLNDALLSGTLSASDTIATKKAIADINETLVFGPRRFPADPFGGNYVVKPGDRLKKIAESYDITWEFLARINGLSDPRKMRSGVPLKVIRGPFTVVVHKKAFTMDIYLGGTPDKPGSMYVRSYSVGLGRDDSTPTGTWMIGTKAKDPVYYSPRGEGVIPADDPKNPLGHRWISLIGMDGKAVGQQSYGIHGTIDPDSIGKQASMGCIRMHNEDVEVVYDMLATGKSLVIVQD